MIYIYIYICARCVWQGGLTGVGPGPDVSFHRVHSTGMDTNQHLQHRDSGHGRAVSHTKQLRPHLIADILDRYIYMQTFLWGYERLNDITTDIQYVLMFHQFNCIVAQCFNPNYILYLLLFHIHNMHSVGFIGNGWQCRGLFTLSNCLMQPIQCDQEKC